MKQFYLTKKINSIVSMVLLLLGLEKENVGLASVTSISTINFSTRNRFGIYSFKAALAFLLFITIGISTTVQAQSIANYAFSPGSASLNAMTSATTFTGSGAITNGYNDDNASAVTNIGFNYVFMGVSYSQFSVNSNGQLRLGSTVIQGTNFSGASAGLPIICPMSGDNSSGITGSTNPISYLVSGSVGSRILMVQWTNFNITFSSTSTNGGTMQLWLYEGSGKIEFHYGSNYGCATASSHSLFISSSNTATTSGYVTVGTTPAYTATATAVTNSLAAGTTIANLSGVKYTFTPSATTTADPTTLTYTAVAPSTTTLNWVDASTNEGSFLVTRANDAGFTTGVVTATVASTTSAATGGAYTSAQTGLVPGTTYYYKIQAISEAQITTGLTGSQATLAGTTYYWVGLAAGADFNTAANWNTAADNSGTTRATATATDVLIMDGAGTTSGTAGIITLAAVGTCGQFLITNNTAVTIQATTATQRIITINGGPGTDLDVPSGSILNLTNAFPASFAFSGTGNTGSIAGTYNAGAIATNVITTTGGTGTLVTVTGTVNYTFGAGSGCFAGSLATLSFANGSAYNQSTFTTTAFLPTATWGATSTATLTGASTTAPTVTGITQSFGNLTISLPTLTSNFSPWTSSTVVLQGNLTVSVPTAILFRAVTSGSLTVGGNLNVNTGTFQSSNGAGSITVLGNTTVASGATLDLSISSGTFSQKGAAFANNGTLACGGTFQFLNLTGSSAQTFSGSGAVSGNFTSMSFQNTAGFTFSQTNQIVTLRTNLFQGAVTGSNKITLGTGAAAAVVVQTGSAGLTTAGGSFVSAPTFNLGTGTYSIVYSGETVARTTGVEIPSSRAIASLQVANTNNVTLAGGNLASTSLILGGNLVTSSSNLLTVTGTATTNVSRSTYASAASATSVGTTITVTSTTGLVEGMIVSVSAGTGAFATNTRVVSVVNTTSFTVSIAPTTALSAATVAGIGGWVVGPMAITLPASLVSGSTYTFPIAKTGYNPFVLVNPTTNSGGTVVVQSEVFDTTTGGTLGTLMGSLNTNRYWATAITAGVANFTNTLVQLNDTPGSFDAIAASATLGGAYDKIGGNTITATGSSLTSTAPATTSLPGFFVMGTKASASLSNLAISPTGNQCTNVARTVTVTVTPGGAAITGVVLNYSLNGVAQSGISMTNTSGNDWSGVIPTVSPVNAAVTWSVTATDANTLTKNAIGTGYQDAPNLGVTTAATASVTTTCAGTPTVLTATLIKSNAATIGTGLLLTGATSQPTAFCNRFSGYRSQTVYTAAELQAAGLRAGTFTSMTYNVTTAGDGLTNAGFTVKIGTTALSALSTNFEATTAYTTVYPSATFTHTASGLQTIPFTTPYVWDGTSNIIIDVTHSGANLTNNSITYYTATTGNSVLYALTTGATTGTQSTQRLDLVFAGSAAPAISSVSWTNNVDSTIASTNGASVSPTTTTTYTAAITANGCVVSPSPTVTITVNTLPSAPTATPSTQCGTATPTCLVTSTSGAGAPTYKWYTVATGGTAIAGQVGASLSAYPVSVSTDFYVTEVGAAGCESTPRTLVHVTVNNPDPITVTPSVTSICLGSSITLNGAVTSGTNANNYTTSYTSTTGSGASTAVTGGTITFGTTGSVSVTPTAAGTYTYTLNVNDSVSGCATSATTVSVTVTAGPNIATWTATPAVACPGSTITLAATSVGLGAGTVTVGTGTSLTGATDQVTAFNNRWPSYRMQMVYTAAELQAAGLSAGNITSMAFNIATLGDSATNASTQILIGTTSVSSLTATFESTVGYTTVYPSQTYTHTASGIQTIPFSTPFVWNGTSNIIIDMVQSGADSANNSQTYYTVTSANTVSSTLTASTGTPTAFNTRPNLVFGGQTLVNVSSSYDWSWNSTPAINAASGTTILPVAASTTYTVTATSRTAPFCSTSKTVTVSTNVAAFVLNGVTPASTSICNGSSITLTAAPTGGCIPYTYSWNDGTGVVGTSATLLVTPTSTKTYTVSITDNAGTVVGGSTTITVNNPQPASVTGQTKCGTSAAFVLNASLGTVGNTLNWYAASTGGASLGTGTSYTTPVITAPTTNYYVEERALGSLVTGIGLDATSVPANTGASSERGIVFTATKAFTLVSAQYYSPTTSVSNTVSVRLLDNTTGTVITTKTLTIPQGASAAWYTMNLGFDITPGTYRLLTGFSQSVNRTTAGLTFPYAMGSVGSITSGYDGGVTSASFSYFHNISIQEFCIGTRVPVAATLSPPPTLTLSATTASICPAQTTSTVAITAGDTSYDVYSWSPATNVTGTSSTGWTFNPSTTTTYTLTASQSAGSCSATATVVVTVNPNPAFSVATSTASVCPDGIATLTASPSNSAPSTYSLSTSSTAYTAITGTTLGTSAIGDDVGIGNLPIGFTFTYNGVAQTVFAASSNGFLWLGQTGATITGGSANALATNANFIAPFWDDNNTTGGSIIYATTGTAPNRVLTVQWTDMHVGGGGSASNPTISMQAILHENGKIDFVYGPTSTALSTPTTSVGLSGAVGNYLSVTPLTPLATSTVSSAAENTSVTETNLPSGSVLTFTPPTTSVVWTPNTDLYTDAGATTLYNGTAALATIYAKPVATTTYYGTATNVSNCSATQSVVITQTGQAVTPISLAGVAIPGNALSVCLASTSPVIAAIPASVDFDSDAVGITWTSTNTSVATIDANGILTPLTNGTTIIKAALFNGTTGCTSYAANPITVTVKSPVVITTQPLAQSILPGDSTTFTVATTASSSVSGYQWKVSTDGGFIYNDVSNGGIYSGATTATLTLTAASLSYSGYSYLCEVAGQGACFSPTVSNTALLTVANLSVILNPLSQTTCSVGTSNLTFTAGFGGPTPDQILWEIFDGANWTVIDGSSYGTFGTVTFTNDTTTSIGVSGLSILNNGWKLRANAIAFDPINGDTVVTTTEATITVNVPATISAATGNKTVCYSGGTTTFGVTALGATGYVWEYSTNGISWNSVANGTPVGVTYANATTATLGVTTTAATPAIGNYYYRAQAVSPTSCVNPTSTPAQLLINTPTITASGSSSFYCTPGGTAVTLTATGGVSYTWSPATGLSATTGASVSANPTDTTTYTVTGTDASGCSNTAQVTVTVTAAVSGTATASVSTVCPNGAVTLSANATYIGAGAQDEPTGYLASNATSTSDEEILNVTFGTLNNTSTCSITGGSGSILNEYSDFTTVVSAPTVSAGTTVPLSISIGTCGGNFTSFTNVYIDYNRNGIFDAAELAYSSPAGVSGPHVLSGSIAIPITALPGITRMRVFNVEGGSTSSLPTGTYGYGETEDYIVNILGKISDGLTYSWSNGTSVVSTVENPTFNPAVTTTYTVTTTTPGGCAKSSQVTVTVVSGASITTQPVATTVCQVVTATFSVVATGPGLTYQWLKGTTPITGNASATTATLTLTGTAVGDSGNYSVVITPTCGSVATSASVALLVNPTPAATTIANQGSCFGAPTVALTLVGTPSGVTFDVTGGAAIGLTNQTGVTSIPSFTPIVGSAVITVTPKANGCTGTAITFVYTINPLPTTVAVSPATVTNCANGSPILLTGSGGIVTSGVVVGTGTTLNVTTSYPSPLSNYYGGTKHQMLVKASELTALGFVNGDKITALSLNVSTVGSTFTGSLASFTVAVGTTTNTVLNSTSFVSGLTTVRNAATLTVPTTGLPTNLTIPFDTNFTWNGTSNIVIQTSFSNANFGTTTDYVQTTSSDPGFVSTNWYRVDNSSAATVLAAATPTSSGNSRPNMVLTKLSSANYVWSPNTELYTNALGTVAYNGTTPTATIYARPTTTRTYTATATSATGCIASGSTVITVNPTPVATAPATQTYCNAVATSSLVLVGTPSGVTFDISGGAAIGLANQTGVTSIPSFTAITGSATISLTPKANGCTGTAVTFVINVVPTSVAGTASSTLSQVCNGFGTSLSLTGNLGTIQWQQSSSATGPWTNVLGATASSLSTGVLSTTTYYQATVSNSVCSAVSSNVVSVIVNPTPTVTVVADNNVICPNTTTTIAAVAGLVGTYSYVWTVPGSVTNPGNVASFTSGTVGVYKVVITNTVTGCVSTQASTTISISGSCSNTIPSLCGVTLTNIDDQVVGVLVANAQGYRWRITKMIAGVPSTNPADIQSIDTGLRVFKFTQLTSYAFDTAYQVEVAVRLNNVWATYYGSPCTVRTPATTTKILDSQCGTRLTLMTDVVYANIVPYATGYRFRVTNLLTSTVSTPIDRSVREFRFNLLSNISFNTPYKVEVAVRNTDGTYLPYGQSCNVTTPFFPTTQLQTSQCDYTAISSSEVLYADLVSNATAYRFSFVNASSTIVTPPNNVRSVALGSVVGILPGVYSVQVAVQIGGVWGPYGKTCTLTVPGIAKGIEPAVVTTVQSAMFEATAYPNPFADNFKLEVKTNSEDNLQVRVYDMLGKQIEDRLVKSSDIELFEVGANYPSGVYNVIVTQGDNTKTLRVIKR